MHTICALVAEDECHFAALSLAPESGEIESCISDSSVDSFLVTCVNLDLFLFQSPSDGCFASGEWLRTIGGQNKIALEMHEYAAGHLGTRWKPPLADLGLLLSVGRVVQIPM